MKTIKLNYKENIPDNFTGIIEWWNGTKYWYKEGKLHHENNPAIEYIDGRKEWWFEGKLHREDGPAREFPDGTRIWHKEGKLHRLNNPAIEWNNGNKEWYIKGKCHRLDGPAIEHVDGTKYWYIENNLYSPDKLSYLINSCFFLEKAKGQYNLEWLRFLTENGIEEFPIIPGMNEYKIFKKFLKI
jgi:hypothetical protein